MMRKGKLYSKTDPNNRNCGRFYFSYVYSLTFRLSERSPVAAINQRGLNICLSGWTTGERPKCLPDWTHTGVFCDVTPREWKHPRVFTRDCQLGFCRVMVAVPLHSPLSNDPSNTCDVNWSHGNPRRGRTRVKVNIKQFPKPVVGHFTNVPGKMLTETEDKGLRRGDFSLFGMQPALHHD